MTSSTFRHFSRGYLYEDICIRHGSSSLAHILENDRELEKYVKRLVICVGASNEDVLRIFQCCPNVKRVDWFDCPADAQSTVSPPFWTLPSLKILSIGSDQWRLWYEPQGRQNDHSSTQINIQILRICAFDTTFNPGNQRFTVGLPHLEAIVFEKPESTYALFGIARFAEQIKSLELGLHPGFAHSDYLSILMRYFQNATDLYYPIFTTKPTRGNKLEEKALNYNVTRVGLSAVKPLEHITSSESAQPANEREGRIWGWETIGAHFDSLCGERSRFLLLEKVVLYGREWEEYVEDTRFLPFIELLTSHNVSLMRDDCSIVAGTSSSRH